MNRREMLATCVASLCGPFACVEARELEFVPLKAPVELPLQKLADPWAFLNFNAWASRPDGSDLLLQGMAVRLPDSRGVQAFCLYCPHEQCLLKLSFDTKELFCGCHLSTFDLQSDGSLVANSGPASRGAYRFRCDENGSQAVISEIEADALHV